MTMSMAVKATGADTVGEGGVAIEDADERQAFLAAHRQVLLDQRAAYASQVEQLRERAAELLVGRDMVDLPGGDEEFGEGDTVNSERDGVLALAAAAQKRVDETDTALAQIAAGTYGICRGCRQPIPAARLEAIPDATHCVACKSAQPLRRR